MSRIGELIQELCPKGVKYLPLGQVAMYSESRIDASSLDKSNFVGVDNLLSNQAGKADANYLPNTPRLTGYVVGDVLLGNIRPYLKKIWLATNEGGCSGDVLVVRRKPEYQEQILPGFLYRLLSSDAFFAYDTQHSKGAKMPRGDKRAILEYKIPLPPIAIQRQIVKILDTFTELGTGLAAELAARRLQYEYYRDTLLSFAGRMRGAARDSVKCATLGEIGAFVRGRRFTKDDYASSGIACIHYADIYTHYGTSATKTISQVRAALASSLRFANPGDIVIAAVGETVEDVGKAVAWLGNGPVAVHDDCFLFRHSMDPKFVSYCFQTKAFNAQKNKYVARAKVKRLSGEDLAKLSIPIPPIAEQAHIVAILDKFDAS